MRMASVCSGIGGAELAFHGLAHCVWASEIEAFPRAVLAHRFPSLTIHRDFRDIETSEPVDVLVGGTPCQSFSVAGLRRGMEDERGNLALEYLRLVDRLRPTWVVWENVPGVLSSNDGRDFGAFVGGLAECGYRWAYRVLDAQHFGVAQRRQRVFVVGCVGDWRRAAAVLFEPASLRGDPAPRREAGERTAPTLASRATAGGGLGTDFECDGGLIAYGGNNTSGAIDVATAVNAHGGPHGRLDFDSETFVTHALPTCSGGGPVSEDGTGRGTPLVAVPFRENQRGEVKAVEGGVVQALSGGGGKPGQGYPAVAFTRHGVAYRMHFDGAASEADTAWTLDAYASHASANQGANLVAASLVRRLTPTECERLQGYPDGWTVVPWRGGMASDGPRYRAIGNAFAVPVVRWIAWRIAREHAALAADESEAAA